MGMRETSPDYDIVWWTYSGQVQSIELKKKLKGKCGTNLKGINWKERPDVICIFVIIIIIILNNEIIFKCTQVQSMELKKKLNLKVI